MAYRTPVAYGRWQERRRRAQGKNVEARWLPNDALLEISHSIRKDGAFSCGDCHRSNGVLDLKALGYSEDEIKKLEVMPLQ